MDVFNPHHEARWDPLKHVENVLGRMGEGDVTVACLEAGKTSPRCGLSMICLSIIVMGKPSIPTQMHADVRG